MPLIRMRKVSDGVKPVFVVYEPAMASRMIE
jgi:hypothetical protein